MQAAAWGASGQRAIAQRFSIEVCERRIAEVYAQLRAPARSTPADRTALLVVIPARDEAESIVSVIAALQRLGLRDILVINDQSTDDTAELATKAGATVLNPVLPLGAWGAMQAGIRLFRGVQTLAAAFASGKASQ